MPRRGGPFIALNFAYIARLSASVIASEIWGKPAQSGAILHAIQKLGKSENNQIAARNSRKAVKTILGDMLNGRVQGKENQTTGSESKISLLFS